MSSSSAPGRRSRQPECLRRVEAALAELNAQPWGVDAPLLGIDLDAPTLAAGGNFSLVTRAGGLDFFNEVPGGAPYEQLRARSVVAHLGDGLEIPSPASTTSSP